MGRRPVGSRDAQTRWCGRAHTPRAISAAPPPLASFGLADLPAKTNVVFIRKAEPPEPVRERRLDTPVQALISQAVEQLRAELREQREDVLEWCRGVLAELIAAADNDLSRQAKALRAEFGRMRTKTLEADIAELRSENSALRADIEGLKAIVDQLAAQLLELSGDVAARRLRSGRRQACCDQGWRAVSEH